MTKQDRHRMDSAEALETLQFLLIPPFPGAKVARFELADAGTSDPEQIVEALRRDRVGGTYWGARPAMARGSVIVRAKPVSPGQVSWPEGDIDPWHVLDGAAGLICAPNDPIALVALVLDVPVQFAIDGQVRPALATATEFAGQMFPAGIGFVSPFTGEALTVLDAIALCGSWRRLIDANRGIDGGFGFAFWKKDAIATLLWNGSQPFQFLSRAEEANSVAPVAIWHTRTAPAVVGALEAAGVPLIEVEDGFLRSRGLGADCIPPLSIVVDRLGPYFDPSRPSELESLLQDGEFDPALLARAARLRTAIVDAGLGKYEAGGEAIERFAEGRRHILVPGQVEDDRSIVTGGAGLTSNLDLLLRVRQAAPDAFIVYKPHPDVLAGHRAGATAEPDALRFADTIVTDQPIASLLDMVDEVHVNTSLTGFEALLRGKAVTTHGVPFYAGWGLTTDLGPVPTRRTARRSIDELVAAALILYPRYLDPVTGLPCPVEIAVSRLAGDVPLQGGMIVALRRMQGRVMKRVRSVRA